MGRLKILTQSYLTLVLIRLARKFTHYGFVDDHLAEAETTQLGYIKFRGY